VKPRHRAGLFCAYARPVLAEDRSSLSCHGGPLWAHTGSCQAKVERQLPVSRRSSHIGELVLSAHSSH